MTKSKKLTISIPKGFKTNRYTAVSGNPVGKTVFKFKLKKGRFPIPFPFVKKVEGIGWKLSEVRDASINGQQQYIFKRK